MKIPFEYIIGTCIVEPGLSARKWSCGCIDLISSENEVRNSCGEHIEHSGEYLQKPVNRHELKRLILARAEHFQATKTAEGWTKERFARELELFLDSPAEQANCDPVNNGG